MLETLGLGFLTNIVSTFFSEAIKNRLKPRSSPEKARQAAFYLYELLDEISASSDAFVSALRNYVTSVKTFSARPRDPLMELEWRTEVERQYREKDAPWEVPRLNLLEATYSLTGPLEELPAALRAVYPQLDIFQPDLVQNLEGFARSRAATIVFVRSSVDEKLKDAVMKLSTPPTDLEPLQQLLSTAENNQQIIEKTTQDMRDFLAKEFTFKESF
jgi:hypothetical protein